MLVLTRKVGDVIAIGDNIKIIVMSVKGKQVRLGIEADKNTIVHREEIYQKIKQENTKASLSTADATAKAQKILGHKNLDENKEPKKIIIRKKDC